jgi:aminopeptidase N
LRVDVVRALTELGDVRSRPALARQLDRELDGRVRRRLKEALRDIAGGPRQEQLQLRDEIDRLRTEHAELAAKVAKLEGSRPSAKSTPS